MTVLKTGKLNYAASFGPHFKATFHTYFTETAIPECIAMASIKQT